MCSQEVPYNSLVIAGGASKCISAIGALYYLHSVKELDFIEHYAGTSAGGMLCYLLAIGYTPFEVIHFLCSSNFIDEFQCLNIAGVVEQKGLINYYIVQEYLEKLTINKIGFIPTFRDVRLRFGKNLTLVTYNLTKNKPEYLNADTRPEMSCLSAIRMTVNVPLLFERFFYNNCEYLDGGLVDNFPINYYSGPEHKILGININPVDTSVSRKQNYIMYLLKIAMIPYIFFQSKKEYPENATVVEIQTDVQSFDFNLTISKRLNLFSKGYQTTLQFFDPVKEPPKEPEEVKEPLKEPEEVKEPPKEPAEEVKEPPKEPAEEVKELVKEPAEEVKELVKELVKEPAEEVKELVKELVKEHVIDMVEISQDVV
jgi:NTE family protein